MRRTFLPLLVALSLGAAACDGSSSTTDNTGGSGGDGGSGASGGSGGSGGAGAAGGAGGQGGTGGHQVEVGSIDITIHPDIFCNLCFELPAGAERQYAATVYDPGGNILPDVQVTWSIADEEHASIDAQGNVKALKKGTTQIVASAGGVTAARDLFITPAVVSKIEVTPPGAKLDAVSGTVDFDAVAYDLDGKPIPDAELFWFASNDVVASVNSTTGVATPAAQGTVAVQVTTDGGGWGAAMLVVVSPLPATAPFTLTQIAAGGNHSCGLDAAGKAYCWGWNFYGQLGDGEVLPPGEHQPVPKAVKGGKTFTKIFAGGLETCGLDAAGAAHCWGSQESGSLGNGQTQPGPVTEPTPVLGGHAFTKLALGGGQSCGITTAGALHCWGLNAWGAVGDGSGVDKGVPVPVAAGSTFTDVTAGLYSTCAIRSDGKALCWGMDDSGQLGQGRVGASSPTPVEVVGDHVFTKIDMYGSFVCAIDDGQAIWCWGRNDTSQIGQAESFTGIPKPTKIGSALSFVDVTAGAFHACGVASDGHAVCWGDDLYGQLGDGSVERSVTPVEVVGGLSFADLESGPHHTCAVTATNGAYCWGTGYTGQLGGGFGGTDADFSVTPWPVAQPAQ